MRLPKRCIGSYIISIKVPVGYINVKLWNGRYESIHLTDQAIFSEKVDIECNSLDKLISYLSGKAVRWTQEDVLLTVFTPFQRRLFSYLREYVPFGSVITYGSLAEKLGTSPRGVAMSLKYNPLPIILPCHRVIAKNGLGGFSAGLKWKRYLLNLEGFVYENSYS